MDRLLTAIGGQGEFAYGEEVTDATRFDGPIPTTLSYTRTYFVMSPEQRAALAALNPELRKRIEREITDLLIRRWESWRP